MPKTGKVFRADERESGVRGGKRKIKIRTFLGADFYLGE